MGPATRLRRSLSPRWPVALTDSPRAPFWLARILESSGEWLFLVWLLLAGWRLEPDPRTNGLLLAAWLVARPALAYLSGGLGPTLAARWPAATLLAAQALTVGAAATFGSSSVAALIFAALIGGSLAGLSQAARGSVLGRLFGGSAVSAAGGFDVLIGRLAMVAGPLLATAAALVSLTLAGWLATLSLLGAALILVGLVGWERRSAPLRRPLGDHSGGAPASALAPGGAADDDGATGFRPLVQSRAATYLVAALSVGALSAALLAALPLLVSARAGFDVAFVGAAIALVGLGALGLRLPVARLRARLPGALVVATLVWGVALAVALIGALGWLVVGVPLLVIVGALAAGLDSEALIRLRRFGDRAPAVLRWLVTAFALGQLAGALAIAVLGLEPQSVGGPLVIIAFASSALMAVALVVDRRSLFALRHQVQQFSWSADPPPRPYELAAPATRVHRLERWIAHQAEIELVDVTLPVSGRHYAIARPSGDGRDSLFEAAKADPDRQMPYWAKVWPSGVALADIVVERAAEVRGQQVLELGAGLGVTACAVLEEGGNLVTADYSLLPLALCRLNGIANTGRAPGSICFNWRDHAQVEEVLRRHPPIGLILAADVLYEGRDVMPLVDVVERLLAPDGSLWLAEPVRRTAQRFLDHIAALGWQVDSRRIRASWPDASSGWVNIHVIRREAQPAEAAIGLGAWRI